MNKNSADLPENFMKTKTVKKIYIKMLKFKIKEDERVNKIKLNKRFSKTIKLARNLNGIIVKDNIAFALHWSGNSETWNKQAELNTLWFWEKMWLAGWSRRVRKALTRLYRKRQRWDVWEGVQVDFGSLYFMTKGIK